MSTRSSEDDYTKDLGDDFVAALRLVGDLLKSAAGDDLKALLAGDAKLRIIPKGWKVTAPGAATTAGTTPRTTKVKLPPLPEIRTQLLARASTADQRAFLHALDMNKTQAQGLAKDLGVKGASRSTIDEAIDKIVTYFADSIV